MKASFLLVWILLVLGSCMLREKAAAPEENSDVKKYYYSDGKTLYMEVPQREGVVHGKSKQYFKNGQVFEQIEYVNGIKHGTALKYYEDGTLSQETPYDSGRVHGILKKYRKDGKLSYEAPYHYDEPCVGVKEYYLSGRQVDKYPSIIIEEDKSHLKDNRFCLRISLSDNIKRVEFFNGRLKDGKYIDPKAESIWIEKPGIARLDYFVPPDAFVMEKLNIIARFKTELGNSYIIERSYNLAFENRY